MDGRVHVALLAAVVLAVAVTVAGAAADDGARSSAGAAAASGREEAVVHRRVLASSIQNSVLNPNKPACLRSCTAAGQPYTGRGCTSGYQCKG